ncbi:hypothetical protein WKW77_19940 [Variovorax ureilyticus]|uniref:Uncharacterized protein n=1 Tax=Variovorax ureilyticus TaxID=1836198 RepID=A0ABU8VI79_9BURK
MRSLLLAVLALMSGCAELGKPAGSALEPPLMGHYCDAPVDGACLGCEIRCPYQQRASCKTGVTTRVAGNPQGVCTRGAVCECK